MRKVILTRLVVLLFIALAGAFIVVLFSSLVSAPTASSDPQSILRFADIQKGATGKRRIDGIPVWVSHLSSKQIDDLTRIKADVVDDGGCQRKQYCIIDARTKQQGIDLSFTAQRPPQVPDTTAWLGGFVNPLNGAVYDLLGRAYRLNAPQYQTALPVIALLGE
jgi:hypothetical protein